MRHGSVPPATATTCIRRPARHGTSAAAGVRHLYTSVPAASATSSDSCEPTWASVSGGGRLLDTCSPTVSSCAFCDRGVSPKGRSMSSIVKAVATVVPWLGTATAVPSRAISFAPMDSDDAASYSGGWMNVNRRSACASMPTGGQEVCAGSRTSVPTSCSATSSENAPPLH